MIKILAYKYATSADVVMQRTIKPTNYSVIQDNIQSTIKKLLFSDKYNYLLIGITGKMFICESVDNTTQVYSSRQIFYHPDENKIA